ncbi:MAG: alanyl-tRNA editing protein [Candidatus Thorarchaeota archaeon]
MDETPVYWDDPLKDSFTVTIRICNEIDDTFEIGIDEHVVRPAGGGQAGDRGFLVIEGQEIQVIDTAIKNDIITLIASKEVPEGSSAELIIDMRWRRAMMQNHTGEHLFMQSVKKINPELELGYIWIDGDSGVIEILGECDIETVLKAEGEVQKLIAENLPLRTEIVSVSEIDPDIRAREGVSSKDESIRVIHIGDVDSSACSGTHVIATGEIGFFKVVNVRPEDNKTQVEFYTGLRAAQFSSEILNQVLLRKHSYPLEMIQVGAVLDKGKEAREEYVAVQEKAIRLLAVGRNHECRGDVIFHYEYLPGFDFKKLRNAVKELRPETDSARFFFVPGEPCNFMFLTNGLKLKATDYISEIVASLGGRGGGGADAYTGGFVNIDNPEELFEKIVKRLKEALYEGK